MADDSICIITNEPKLQEQKSADGVFYNVKLQGKELEFRFCSSCLKKNKIDFVVNKHLLIGLLLNNKVYKSGKELIHWDEKEDENNINLKTILVTSVFPKTPQERKQNLFIDLFNFQNYEGEWIEMTSYINLKQAYKLYFRNTQELKYYLKALEEENNVELYCFDNSDSILKLKITFKGLNTYATLIEHGINSKNCFVAMNFDDNVQIKQIESAIRKAITDAGFHPIIVSDIHVNSDKTIPDEIIYLLRSCKFCVADFTGHKKGVYFESGFALGLGKPVIYTCHSRDFNEAHFDIKQLQHILYDSPEELQKRLSDKIKAWIS